MKCPQKTKLELLSRYAFGAGFGPQYFLCFYFAVSSRFKLKETNHRIALLRRLEESTKCTYFGVRSRRTSCFRTSNDASGINK